MPACPAALSRRPPIGHHHRHSGAAATQAAALRDWLPARKLAGKYLAPQTNNNDDWLPPLPAARWPFGRSAVLKEEEAEEEAPLWLLCSSVCASASDSWAAGAEPAWSERPANWPDCLRCGRPLGRRKRPAGQWTGCARHETEGLESPRPARRPLGGLAAASWRPAAFSAPPLGRPDRRAAELSVSLCALEATRGSQLATCDRQLATGNWQLAGATPQAPSVELTAPSSQRQAQSASSPRDKTTTLCSPLRAQGPNDDRAHKPRSPRIKLRPPFGLSVATNFLPAARLLLLLLGLLLAPSGSPLASP